MDYGKKSTHESYERGVVTKIKTEYAIPVRVLDKTQALTEIIKGLELITNKETCKVTLEITADPVTHHFRMVRKSYIVEE